MIKGEIILSSLSIPKELYGIGIRVRGVLIKRETFGMESSHDTGSRRLTGEVQADFLSITTDRNNIITDTAQYQEFFHIMQKKLKRVIKQIEKSAAHYQDSKAERMLSDVLLMIRESLKKIVIFLSWEICRFLPKKPPRKTSRIRAIPLLELQLLKKEP